MNDRDRSRIERRLRDERDEALEAIAAFEQSERDLRESTGELSLYPQHPADLGSEAMEREKEFLLASAEGRRLYEIDAALRRLYQEPDQFGRCERCGADIPLERLELLPTARLCMQCQNGLEAAATPR